jgi:hypothetical protein
LFAAVLAAAIIAGVVAGCGQRGPEAGGRILLVGIDSADWDIIGPLVEEGKLPNLTALVESGVSCDLHSLEPKQKSPTIWATIATGKLPEKHGITDFMDPLTKKILTSNVRTARTFWDIIGERGMTVTVIGWLVSWPAEVVNGYMVTDYFRYSPKPDRPLPEHLTYPDDLRDEVELLRVVSEDITEEYLDRFIDLDAAMTADEAQRLPIEQMFVDDEGDEGARAAGELPAWYPGRRPDVPIGCSASDAEPPDRRVHRVPPGCRFREPQVLGRRAPR